MKGGRIDFELYLLCMSFWGGYIMLVWLFENEINWIYIYISNRKILEFKRKIDK